MKIETQLLERNDLDRVLNLAMVTGENVLIAGPPGTAKTTQAQRAFAHFPKSKHFQAQLTKFSTEDVLFGPLDIGELRKGKYVHNATNTILDADFAYIDEIFDASDVLLRSLLSVLNEHTFSRGEYFVECPLQMAIGTANYIRNNELNEAVLDRFLFQMNVQPLQDKSPLMTFREEFTPCNTYSIKELQRERQKLGSILFSRDLQEALISVATELGFTDRRIAKSVNVIKASALLDGRHSVDRQDIFSIRFLASLDDAGAKSSKAVLQDLLETAVEKSRQIGKINDLRRNWEDIDGNPDDMDFLRAHASVIRSLLAIEPINEEIAEMRDEVLANYQEYYSDLKMSWMRRNAID